MGDLNVLPAIKSAQEELLQGHLKLLIPSAAVLECWRKNNSGSSSDWGVPLSSLTERPHQRPLTILFPCLSLYLPLKLPHLHLSSRLSFHPHHSGRLSIMQHTEASCDVGAALTKPGFCSNETICCMKRSYRCKSKRMGWFISFSAGLKQHACCLSLVKSVCSVHRQPTVVICTKSGAIYEITCLYNPGVPKF